MSARSLRLDGLNALPYWRAGVGAMLRPWSASTASTPAPATGRDAARRRPRGLQGEPARRGYGDVDELNAVIGLARAALAAEAMLDAVLGRIQNDLFDLGADLATPAAAPAGAALRIVAGQVARLEREIDALNAELPPLTSFVLPGGSPPPPRCTWRAPSAAAPNARRWPSSRRGRGRPHAQRCAISTAYRDLLFVAARFANGTGRRGDVLWVPAATR